MTEKTFTEQTLTVAATELRLGDRLAKGRVIAGVAEDTATLTVAQVTVGPKRVTVKNADGKEIGYFLREDKVDIVRTVETEESKALRLREYTNEVLAQSIESAKHSAEKAAAKLAEDLASGHAWLLAGNLTAVAEAEAEAACWRTVEHNYEYATKNGHGTDLLDAARLVEADFAEHLLSGRSLGESRSTSQMSNLIDSINDEAKARFIREMRYYKHV